MDLLLDLKPIEFLLLEVGSMHQKVDEFFLASASFLPNVEFF